ncbi:flippase [Geomonas sp. RF6]|uniref:flippase n=1 Tax=Geomonas sp. RF6 TaxID=2897342 RepID=UPI001E59A9C1|nr:flippase [Geomonas sp. RF6]UFS71040.1 flippase [Geomonas sp. RF6]
MKASLACLLPASVRSYLEGRHYLKKAISSTGWHISDSVLRMGVGLLVNIWVTRYLGPERFGVLSYATAFVSLVSSIGLLGLDGVAVRNLVRNPAESDTILGSTFLLKAVGALCAFAATVASILVLRPGDPASLALVAIISIGTLFQAFGTVSFHFQAEVRSKYPALARSGAFLAVSAAKVVLILVGAPLVAFAWAASAEIVLGSVALVAAYRCCGGRMTSWRASLPMVRELLHDSWPLLLSDLSMLMYLRMDKLILGELKGNTELGIYSVAALLAEGLYFIPTAVYTSAFPRIVESRAAGEAAFQECLQRFYNLMALLGYGIAIPVTLVAWWLVPLLFGASYQGAALMLVGLAWGGIFINLMMARSQYLTAMNWTRLHFITDFLGAAVNILLNFILIPRYGGMGAVAASGIAYWFVAHGSCFLFPPLRRTGTMMTRSLLYPRVW